MRKNSPISAKSSLDRHIYTNIPTINGDAVAVGKYQAAAKLTPREYEGVEHLVEAGYFLNVSDFVRSAVREKLGAMRPAVVRKIPSRTAQKEIYNYVKSHPDVYPDEIADALSLDMETVMDAVAALVSQKKVGESA